MLEVNDIMLNKRVILDFYHMKNKLPWHWILCLLRKISKMCNTFIYNRLGAASLDWNEIWFISSNRFLVEEFFIFDSGRNAYFFIGQVAVIKDIKKFDGRIERNRHTNSLIWSKRQHFINKDFWKIFCDLY